jgi:hypothetical protein
MIYVPIWKSNVCNISGRACVIRHKSIIGPDYPNATTGTLKIPRMQSLQQISFVQRHECGTSLEHFEFSVLQFVSAQTQTQHNLNTHRGIHKPRSLPLPLNPPVSHKPIHLTAHHPYHLFFFDRAFWRTYELVHRNAPFRQCR